MTPRLGRASPWSSVRGLSKQPSHAALPNCRNQRQELRSSRTRALTAPPGGRARAYVARDRIVATSYRAMPVARPAFSDSVADVIGIRTSTSQASATIRDRPRPSHPVTRTSGAVARSRSRIGSGRPHPGPPRRHRRPGRPAGRGPGRPPGPPDLVDHRARHRGGQALAPCGQRRVLQPHRGLPDERRAGGFCAA